MRNFLAMLAEMERSRIRDRVAATSGSRARAGLLESRPTYGLRSLGGGKCEWLRDEAEVVRLVYRLCSQGRSLHEISRDLTEAGILTTRGRQWDPSTVRQRIRNPMYKGLQRHNGEFFPLSIGGVVDAELWEKANRQLDLKGGERGGTYGRPSLQFLAQGLLWCGTCGSRMRVRTSPNRRQAPSESYFCPNRRHGGDAPCQQEPIAREFVDEAILRYFIRDVLDVEATLQRHLEAESEHIAATTATLRQLEREQMRLESEESRMWEEIPRRRLR